MGSPSKTAHQHLDRPPEQALFSSLDGMVATFHTNERPLLGLSGLLDWYFHGAISKYLRAGAVSGEVGECAYLPLTLPNGSSGRLFHILLIGCGVSPSPGKRGTLDEKNYSVLKKNIESLKVPRLGISLSDFGNVSRETLNKHFKELPLWIVR